jgi:hypothetical protein
LPANKIDPVITLATNQKSVVVDGYYVFLINALQQSLQVTGSLRYMDVRTEQWTSVPLEGEAPYPGPML